MVLGAAQCPLMGISPPSQRVAFRPQTLFLSLSEGHRQHLASAVLLALAPLYGVWSCVHPIPNLEEWGCGCRLVGWGQELWREERG